jgi:hypothetical protein
VYISASKKTGLSIYFEKKMNKKKHYKINGVVTLALTFFNSHQIEAQLGHENPKLLPSLQGGPIAHWPAPGKAGDGGEAREA